MLRLAPPQPVAPDAAPFAWLLREDDEGRRGALLTISAVHGGAPRPIGAQMAVSCGTRFDGYLSGGCVEPAIAQQVQAIIAGGRDALLRFGKGSPFFDIQFPCGGGIDVLVHVVPEPSLLEAVLESMAWRQPFTLEFEPTANRCVLREAGEATGWRGSTFERRYLPRTRLCVAGRGPELETVARLGVALNYDVVVGSPDAETLQRLANLPIEVLLLSNPADAARLPHDPWTATVLLFHERAWEDPILESSLGGSSFYIGALGSARTHGLRRERLFRAGFPETSVDRVAGPIGLIPAAKDPETLALSVLAEIALHRRQADAVWRAHPGA